MGRRIYTTIPQPTVGTDFSDVPNYGEPYKLISLCATLTTSATVANRNVDLELVDRNGNVYWYFGGSYKQIASSAILYAWTPVVSATEVGSVSVANPVPDIWVPEQFSWKSVTNGIQAGDQWSDIALLFVVGDEWEHLKMLSEIAASITG